MITRENLSELTFFSPAEYLTTTLYLQLDGSPQPSYAILLKDLIRMRKQELEKLNLNAEVLKSVQADFKAMQDFVNLKFSRERVRSLILFSCSAKKWWKDMTLSLPISSQLVVQSKPYLRPLSMALEEYQRFLVVVFDRSRARMFEIYAGEMQEDSSILDEVPGRVKVGGFGGSQERRIERHTDDHVRRHFKNVADKAYELFKRIDADSLILAANEQHLREFHYFLSAPLHDRIAGEFGEEVNVAPKALLEKTLRIEDELRHKNQKKTLDRFFNRINSGGLAIAGLDPTIRALQQGQVNLMLVQEGYRKNGYRCTNCSSLLANNSSCDYCGGKTKAVDDIVDEAIQEAYQQGCEVRFISLPDSPLVAAGNIGAMLRFRP